MLARITTRTEDLIEELVASGQYADETEVLEKAVLLLRQYDHNERIIASINEASESVRRGEFFELTDDLWLKIHADAEKADRLGLPINPDVCP